MKKPVELSSIFKEEHFVDYPFVKIPQEFFDSRGSIQNIADGSLGDVAVIRCEVDAIRANHYHDHDWHLTFMISGSMEYEWSEKVEGTPQNKTTVSEGQMVYTPSGAPHKMTFKEKSIFIAVAALSRNQENYEADTKRLSPDYFKG